MAKSIILRVVQCGAALCISLIVSVVFLYPNEKVVLDFNDTIEDSQKNEYVEGMCTFIMTYKRPNNVMLLLNHTLSTWPDLTNEIVVAFGHSDYYFDISKLENTSILNTNITFVKDWENNDKYFTLRRFITSIQYCSSDNILILDDDILPARDEIIRLQNEYKKNTMQMYGFAIRWCSEFGYYASFEANIAYKLQKVLLTKHLHELVLTGYFLTNKHIIKQISNEIFNNIVFRQFTNQVIEYKGNGEDILFNFMFMYLFKQNPIGLQQKGIFTNVD